MSVVGGSRETGRLGSSIRTMVVLAVLAVAVPVGASEAQQWGRAGVRAGVAGSILSLRVEHRAEDGLLNGYYSGLSTGIERPLGKHLLVGLSYARIERRSGSAWSVEHRPYADAALGWKVAALGIQDRNRLELRLRGDDEAFRYRNRLKLSHPLGETGLRVSVDDEVFVDLEDWELNRNRLTTGVQLSLPGSLSVGAFHVLESSKTGDGWTDFNAVGASVDHTLQF